MENTELSQNLLQFKAKDSSVNLRTKPLSRGRFLLGTIDACDIYIADRSIAPIHAVVEVTAQGVKVFSLVENGLSINGKVEIVSDLKIGDQLKVGSVTIELSKFTPSADLPTLIMDELPEPPSAELDRNKSVIIEENKKAPYIIYPFDQNYNFDASEYIFEDADNLYPIFKYNYDKLAVEVILLYNDRILSIDYLPQKDGSYKLAGIAKKDDQIEFSYLGANDTCDFLECQGGQFTLENLYDFETVVFSDNKEKEKQKRFVLDESDIVRFQKGCTTLFVRRVEAPPHVLPAPKLPRDRTIYMLYFLLVFLISIPMYFFYTMEVDKEDLEKKKAPERIARIIYNRPEFKKNKITEQKPAAQVKKKAEAKPVKKPTPKKEDTPKRIVKKDVPVKKGTPPPKTPVPNKEIGVKKKVTQTKSSRPSTQKKVTSKTASPTPKSRGTVDVYRNNKFVSSVSNYLAKGGDFTSAKTAGVAGGTQGMESAKGIQGESGISTSKISDNIGDLQGTKTGVEGISASAQGLVSGKEFYTAGVPSETVVLGSMDPDIIRKILRDHLPQFRYCYQKVLDRSGRNISGVVKLIFTIGASGNVSKAGVGRGSQMPASVQGCVVNVLNGIRFPAPRGGGTVEVRQPLNFYGNAK